MPPTPIIFDDLVHECYVDPTLFPILCHSRLGPVLTARNWSMSASDITTIEAKIKLLTKEEQNLYAWMFQNTAEKTATYELSENGGATWP